MIYTNYTTLKKEKKMTEVTTPVKEEKGALEMLKDIAKEMFAKMEWEKVLWTAYSTTLKPMLLKKVTDSSSKIDDVIFKGVDKLIETYLGPKE